jgi:CubicO group peptidase (beta-lactamase class C family)
MKKILFSFLSFLITFISSAQQEEIDKLLSSGFKNDAPGGVVFVAKKGRPIYVRSFGLANLAQQRPVNDSMVFFIGSNTKQFTTVAALQLVEKGKLQLSDTLGKWYPAFNAVARGITIERLLSHTSGINDQNQTYFRAIAKNTPGFDTIKVPVITPGKKWEYHNANFAIIGLLIEKLSGESYAGYIMNHLLIPAGMTRSSVDRPIAQITNMANGYHQTPQGIQPFEPGDAMGPSGGIQSTAYDMLKWNRALHDAKLLKPETLAKAFTREMLSDGSPTPYGMGWYTEELRGTKMVRHGGLVPGTASETLYLPDEDLYVVILINNETSPFPLPLPMMSQMIAAIAINKPFRFERSPVTAQVLKAYEGVYEAGNGDLLNLIATDTAILYQRPNGMRYTIWYAGNDEFYFDRDYLRIHFIREKNEELPTKLVLSRLGLGPAGWTRTNKPLLRLLADKLSDSAMNNYTGTYTGNSGDTLVVKKSGANLLLLNGRKQLVMAASTPGSFITIPDQGTVAFQFENNQLILTWNNGDRKQNYTRR